MAFTNSPGAIVTATVDESTLATEATLQEIEEDIDQFTFNATRLLVDGSGVVQPVSGTLTVAPPTSTTGTRTDIARSNANQTFLVSNVNRKGATIYNDAAANLFIKLGATATTSDFIVRLQSQDYYEVPFNYTGRIDGIWASNGAGSARITELT